MINEICQLKSSLCICTRGDTVQGWIESNTWEKVVAWFSFKLYLTFDQLAIARFNSWNTHRPDYGVSETNLTDFTIQFLHFEYHNLWCVCYYKIPMFHLMKATNFSFLKIIDRLSSVESIYSGYVIVTMYVSESSFLIWPEQFSE